MKAPASPHLALRSPPAGPGFRSTAGNPLVLSPGSAVCLRCGWLAGSAEDAAAAAHAHTEATTHPTVYRRPIPRQPAQPHIDERC